MAVEHKSADVLLHVADALEDLGIAVNKAASESRSLVEVLGWNCPALTKIEFAAVPTELAIRLRKSGHAIVSAERVSFIEGLIKRVKEVEKHHVPQLFSGNGVHASSAFLNTLFAIEAALESCMGWDSDKRLTGLPGRLATRLRVLEGKVADSESNTDELQEKISRINAAYKAAEGVPKLLESVSQVLARIENFDKDCAVSCSHIKVVEAQANEFLGKIDAKAQEANVLIEQCEDAYRATTTKGLASSFEKRAKDLNISIRWWVAALAASLVAGTALGAYRVAALSEVLSRESPNWAAIALHMVLSIVSVGAPLWFSWVSTRQLGQRFKLAEDYAFKASVAKAYEGYRREAARIDEAFEARLFSSALTRLDEAPLRVIEKDGVYGSPWSEIIQSNGFRKALDQSQELAERVSKLAESALKRPQDNGSGGQ